MNFSLTPELETMVREKVASGLYVSNSEVVREALRLMDQHDKLERWRAVNARSQDLPVGSEGVPVTTQLGTAVDLDRDVRIRPGDSPNPTV